MLYYYITDGLIKVSEEELQVFNDMYHKVLKSHKEATLYSEQVEDCKLFGVARWRASSTFAFMIGLYKYSPIKVNAFNEKYYYVDNGLYLYVDPRYSICVEQMLCQSVLTLAKGKRECYLSASQFKVVKDFEL